MWIERENRLLQTGIGLIFFLYGLHAVFNTPSTNYPLLQRSGLAIGFFSSFLVVVLNPATFVMFSALFTVSGIAKIHFSLMSAVEIAAAVFTGAVVFWMILSFVFHKSRSMLSDSVYAAVSRISALLILGFGVVIFLYNIIISW